MVLFARKNVVASLVLVSMSALMTLIGIPVHAQSANLRLMPLGDSITDGYRSSTGNGYRGPLYNKLLSQGDSVDFVGSLKSGTMADPDNEGHSGLRIEQVAGLMNGPLYAYRPNIITLHIGSNDMNQDYQLSTAPNRLASMIDQAIAAAPEATVLVAQLIRNSDATIQSRISSYNSQIPGIVQTRANAGKHVYMVSMSSLTTADLADGLHPNDAGYQKMADAWDGAIQQVISKGWINAPATLQAYFNIVNKSSGKSLDLISGNTANSASVNQWSSNVDSLNQRWALQPTEGGNHFKIISWVSGKALCPAQDSTSNDAQIYQWDYTGNNPAQQWDLVDAGNGLYNIRNVRSGLNLDNLNSTADNGKVTQWTPSTSNSQKWRLQPWGDYYFKAEVSGKYVGAVNSPNGSAVVQHSFETQPWYKWHFNSRNDGWFSVQNLYAPGRALCVPSASTTVGQTLHIWDYNINNVGDQKVRIRPRTNGTFTYYFAHDNLAWNIQGAGQADMVPLTQSTNNDAPAQQFRMERLQ